MAAIGRQFLAFKRCLHCDAEFTVVVNTLQILLRLYLLTNFVFLTIFLHTLGAHLPRISKSFCIFRSGNYDFLSV
jgi:hypothetical protein